MFDNVDHVRPRESVKLGDSYNSCSAEVPEQRANEIQVLSLWRNWLARQTVTIT